MNDLILTTYVKSQLAMDRFQKRERGASALEYVGMVLVAAFIVAAVYAALKGTDITGKVGDAVKKILDGPGK